MCYVTNLDHETDACKLTHPETCRNITFTWLEHARPSAKSRGIIGLTVGCSYWKNVTVNRYNGYVVLRVNLLRPHIMLHVCIPAGIGYMYAYAVCILNY